MIAMKLAFLLGLAALEGGDPFVTFELGRGAQLHVAVTPASTQEAIFTFLPHGLMADARGETQSAHLLEHLLVRSTDPTSLVFDGVAMNGETGAGWMRLETLAPPEKWEVALDRHARWWTFAPATQRIAVEAGRMAQEIDTTARRGFTHKWAIAAWCQAIEGSRDVDLRGDPRAATPAAVAAAAARFGLDGMHVVAAGPVAADRIAAAVKSAIAALPPSTAATGRVVLARPEPGDVEAKWDLPGAHLIVWFELPAKAIADRAAATAIARQVGDVLLHRADVAAALAQPLASVDGERGGARFLVVSGALRPGAGADKARAAIDAAIATLQTDGNADDAEDAWAGALRAARVQATALSIGAADPNGSQAALTLAAARLELGTFDRAAIEAAFDAATPQRCALLLRNTLAGRHGSVTFTPAK